MALSHAKLATGGVDDDRGEVVDPDAIYDPESDDDAHAPSAPRLVRAAARMIGPTVGRAGGAYVHAGKRVVGVVVAPATSVELVRDVAAETTRALQTVAEATDLDRRLGEIGPAGALIRQAGRAVGVLLPVKSPEPAPDPMGLERSHHDDGQIPTLREQGAELLRRSRDVNDEYDIHPAYARILSEITPDEARILELMLLDGPQPTVDVRTGGPLGLINSRLIAAGLSMIGARAGCRYRDRVPSYLNNLFRLGLIWFSQETLRTHQLYQVLEAQPDVLEAIHSVPAAKVVRRSIHLTPFGEDFCRFCFTDGVDVGVLPEHSAPKDASSAQPLLEKIEG